MKRIIALILVAVMCALCLAGCGAKKDKLIVGITEYAPMNYKDDAGNWTGFDTEFALAVAEELGMEVEFVVIDWDNKILEVNSGSIDCVWNGMTLTEEVLAGMDCTDPYIKNAQVVVLKADKAADYATVDSIKTLKFAVESGSAGEQALKDNGIEGYTAVLDQAAALLEVESGAADACVIDITMANAMTGEGTNYADLSYQLSLSEELYGVSFRKDSDLTAKFNDFMIQLKNDGTLQELAAKYNLTLAN